MDLPAARTAFLRAIDATTPFRTREFGEVLDELIRWSEQHDWGIQFVAHGGSQGLVKYCVPGVDAHFWSAWPRQVDGAKLHIFADPHPRFPEELRDVARQELAQLDGRTPNPTELPVVSFERLLLDGAMRRVKKLMCQLLHGLPQS